MRIAAVSTLVLALAGCGGAQGTPEAASLSVRVDGMVKAQGIT